MQQIITKELLTTLGVELSDEVLAELADRANTALHERIGAEIVDSLDDDTLEDLVRLQTVDSDKVGQWLAYNIPELLQIVEDERDILIGEIAENADKF